MRHSITIILLICLQFAGFKAISQVNTLEISPEKEKMYSPYMYWHHGGAEGLAEFKQQHPHEYLKELWYFCESWYVKKDYVKEGVPLDLYVVDIERFEQNRKEHEEAILLLPGCRDAIVLLPSDQLIYKPQQK